MHETTGRIVLPTYSIVFCNLLVVLSFFPFDRFQISIDAKLAFVGLEFGPFKLYFGCVSFAAAGALHCKISMLSWILGASIVLSQGFCVSKLAFEPLRSRLHLRHVGVIDRKGICTASFDSQLSCSKEQNLDRTKISKGFKEQRAQFLQRPKISKNPFLVSSSMCAILGFKFR